MSIQIQQQTSSPAPLKQTYFFQAIEPPLTKDKQFTQKLLKWGLSDTLVRATFRFNQKFQSMDVDNFMKDLFNNPNIRYLVQLGYPVGDVMDVKYDDLRVSQTTLDLLDRFEENIKGEYIQKMMSKQLEGIEIPDLVRESLIDEQSEHYCIFSQKQRKQLILKIFQLLVVGGSMNQYEDLITPYLDQTKIFYKSLVTVRKDIQTGDIFVQTTAFQVSKIDNFYDKGYNPQDILYVIINPTSRIVHILYNKWVKFW